MELIATLVLSLGLTWGLVALFFANPFAAIGMWCLLAMVTFDMLERSKRR